MARVAHFEICAEDVERAVSFYRHVFGWEIRLWDGPHPYWIVITGEDAEQPGINGGIVDRRDHFAGSVNLVDVVALDNACCASSRRVVSSSIPAARSLASASSPTVATLKATPSA